MADYRFAVSICETTVELVCPVVDEAEARRVIDALKIVYGDDFYARINKYGKRLAVKIPMYVFKKYDDIRAQVVEVLCRKYGKTRDERKRRIIARHLMRLTTLTKEQPRFGFYHLSTSEIRSSWPTSVSTTC